MKTQHQLKVYGFDSYKSITKEAYKKALKVCQINGFQFHIYRSSVGGTQVRKLNLLPVYVRS